MFLGNLLKYTIGGLKALSMIIQNPKNLYYITHQETVFHKRIKKNYPDFINGLPQIKLTDLDNPVNEVITPYSMLGGTSEPIDIALLRILAKKFEGCKYFEIGTWRGESITNLTDVTSYRGTLNLPLDDPRNSPDEGTLPAHKFYIKESHKIEQIEADSLDFDFSQLPKMDLIFIDGDHHREVVASDSRNVFNHLIHEQSIVVWHDYTTHFSSVWWEVLEGILNGCPRHYHSRIYHVRNTNCAVYLPEPVKSSTSFNQWVPQESFEVHIKSTGK